LDPLTEAGNRAVSLGSFLGSFDCITQGGNRLVRE
jgi:hypothetical protein